MIQGADQVKEAYRDKSVAREYVDQRFLEPFGALLHDRQADAVRRVLLEHRRPRVLEIAPGPARLTVEIGTLLDGGGTLVDTSAQMLVEARRRIYRTACARWRLVRGDALHLPLSGPFDFVYTFRLLRHLEAADRARAYAEIARVLRPGGVLVFDAVNEAVSAPLRAKAPPGEYVIYDALFRPETLRAEIEAAGFDVVSLAGVQHRFPLLERLQVLVAPRWRWLARVAMEVVDRSGGEPLEWIVTCRRRA